MQSSMQLFISWLTLMSCLIAGTSAVGTCTINNEPYLPECFVSCSLFGVNGDTQDPGVAAAEFLSSIYPVYKDVCTDKWILEITYSRFPNDFLRNNWLESGLDQPPIDELLLHTCGLTTIESGAFSAQYLGSNVKKLSIYYNRLNEITYGMTQGLDKLEIFEWVGNEVLTRADSNAVTPFRTNLQVLQISDCGFATASVVSNITGFCNTAGDLPSLKSLELSFNPGPGLTTISTKHFTQLSGVLSMYLWHSAIEYVENNQVFDPVAKTIQTIDLSNNNLKTMPNGTLDSIIAENKPRVSLALAGNPWSCDCHLEYLQRVVKFAIGGVRLVDNNSTYCASPVSEAGKLFIEADMTTSCPPPIIAPPVDINCNKFYGSAFN